VRDFTVKAYKRLLSSIRSTGVEVFGVAKWFKEKPKRGILLRHDVDRRPRNALRIAELENEYNIKSTYYFRAVGKVFQPEIIKRISSLEHEIGYHYEDLSLADGNHQKAIRLFEKHLLELRRLVPVETIAMHGRPFSPYDNRDLWQKYNRRDFGILAEAFLDVDYSNMYYLTDTGRTWGQTKANIRDYVGNALIADVDSTDSLISFLAGNTDKKIALVMHPERWSDSFPEWSFTLLRDYFVNAAKRVYLRAAGLRR
jgi:hypothetical protein